MKARTGMRCGGLMARSVVKWSDGEKCGALA